MGGSSAKFAAHPAIFETKKITDQTKKTANQTKETTD
jgi:hypothetical protein